MNSFQVVRKKTPFQKHREEEEAKKKREQEEAARLYEDFVESFKGDEGGKAFVRGGTINPNEKNSEVSKDPPSGKKPGSRYVPSFLPPGMAAAGLGGGSSSAGPSSGSGGSSAMPPPSNNRNKWQGEREREPRDKWPSERAPKYEERRGGADEDLDRDSERQQMRDRAKVRNIDYFMEELKRDQEMREKRGQGRGSSRFDEMPPADNLLMDTGDDGDPQTTNLYVGNLSPSVDENFLLRTFGRFGPIASVKIMWPRTEEEKRRARNCGFVAFMTRAAAQAAKDEMQGVVVYEYELRIGWGKAVNLPAQALPAPPPGQLAVRPKELELLQGQVVQHSSNLPPASGLPGQGAEVVVTPNVQDIVVVAPEDPHVQHVIDATAMYVLDDGCAFEQAVMERGRGNPIFSFMFELGSPDHAYYMWRLFSFAQGDTLQRWRTEPFIMIAGSGRWIPPPLPVQEIETEREKPHAGVYVPRKKGEERALTDAQRDDFEDMLRALTLERGLIREAMGFALDNAEAAGEVVEVLSESLTLRETPIPTKVARLMLVSDILHNSSAPVKNASAYRSGFQTRLPDIIESFNELYRNITGRITAEALKERVLKVLQVWTDWFLFSEAYIGGLRITFLRSSSSGVAPFHSLPTEAPPDNPLILDETPAREDAEEAAVPAVDSLQRELLSLPLEELERQCRFNGLSTRGGRELMVARLLSLHEEDRKMEGENEDELSKHGNVTGVGGGNDRSGVEATGVRGRGRVDGGGWVEVSRDSKEAGGAKGTEGGSVVQNGRGEYDSAWPMYGDDDDVEPATPMDVKPEPGVFGGKLPATIPIPQPDIKVFGTTLAKVKVEKDRGAEVSKGLAASKWARDDAVFDSSPSKETSGRWAEDEGNPMSSKWAKDLEDEEEEEAHGSEHLEETGMEAADEDKAVSAGGLGLGYSSSEEASSPQAPSEKEEEAGGLGNAGDMVIDEERRSVPQHMDPFASQSFNTT